MNFTELESLFRVSAIHRYDDDVSPFCVVQVPVRHMVYKPERIWIITECLL